MSSQGTKNTKLEIPEISFVGAANKSTTNDSQPLLTLYSSSDQYTKNRNKTVLLLVAFIMIILAATIVTLYATNTWPFEEERITAGVYGKYPIHGGNKENQQISINSHLEQENIVLLEQKCVYNSTGGAFTGYITVDNDDRAYFVDSSRFVMSINIDGCSINWKVNLSDIGISDALMSRNSITLFRTSNKRKGLLLGTPNGALRPFNWSSCYAVALDITDGSLIWKTEITANDTDSAMCHAHGFMVDNNWAYGGFSSDIETIAPNPRYYSRGRVFKININNGELVNVWYTIPKSANNNDASEGFYSGASIWPLHSIIDDYYVFGTGNLFTYPHKTEQCMLGNTSHLPLDDVRPYNPCGVDVSHVLKWRCLEHNIHTDSLIILNKKSFKLVAAIPFAGVDGWGWYCWNRPSSIDPGYCPAVLGPDADAVAIATYHYNGQAYAAVGQKSGQFYVVEIPSGVVKISKKVGPWGIPGGANPFTMAVDEKNMIAIYTFRGNAGEITYRYKMADGTTVCDLGSVHAIDLLTGYTIWQWIHPYGKIGDISCNNSLYDEYIDVTVDGSCERSFNGSNMLPANETCINVIIPPIDSLREPIDSKLRATLIGAATISNNMVFIPTETGEVWIHNIENGEFIKVLQCPDYQIQENGTMHWNREGIRSGVTIYDDKVLFMCYGQMVVMQLQQLY
eukprot:411104_1